MVVPSSAQSAAGEYIAASSVICRRRRKKELYNEEWFQVLKEDELIKKFMERRRIKLAELCQSLIPSISFSIMY